MYKDNIHVCNVTKIKTKSTIVCKKHKSKLIVNSLSLFSKLQIKDILDASLRSDKSSEDPNGGNVCDMACQTR